MDDFFRKKILVVGLGILGGGVETVKFLVKKGARVSVTDLKNEEQLAFSIGKLKNLPINYILGKHQLANFLDADLIIKNPAVDPNQSFLRKAKTKGIPVYTETSLFFKLCQNPIIGITGTRGKSTIAMLIYSILKEAGLDVAVGGNIPDRPALPLLDRLKKDTTVVLELSSWQLNSLNMTCKSPKIALISNIYPDHLNRYKSMGQYVEDKMNIFRFQSKNDYLILNRKNEYTKFFVQKAKSRIVYFDKLAVSKKWQVKLKGDHNLENIAAAWQVAKIMGLSLSNFKKAMRNFRGLQFRLEEVAVIKGITFVNDTTATTPIALLSALKTYEKPLVLICGGQSKNLPLDDLIVALKNLEKSKIYFLKGSGTEELLKLAHFKNQNAFKIYDDLGEVVSKGFIFAQKRSIKTILFSPGFTSFASFANEFERGEKFNYFVNRLL